VSLVCVTCYQVESSASGWSVIQRIPTDCGESESDIEHSTTRKPGPIRGGWPMKKIQNIYYTYIYHSQIWHRYKLSRCQLEPLVSCSNDEHQTSLKWDSSSHPVTPECCVLHTLRLKNFTINFSVLFNRLAWFLGLVMNIFHIYDIDFVSQHCGTILNPIEIFLYVQCLRTYFSPPWILQM